jgi:hypothetical protein
MFVAFDDRAAIIHLIAVVGAVLMDRREFFKEAGAGGTVLLAANACPKAQAEQGRTPAGAGPSCGGACQAMAVRPYQLLCVVCEIGSTQPRPKSQKIDAIRQAVRAAPDRPISVVCNAGDVYAYQDPGAKDDTPEGRDFNRKRDLDILQRLDLAPGSTLPARTLFYRVLKQIASVAGICGYAAATSAAWRGCPRAQSGSYEAGHKRGIDAIVPPRTEEEMAREKTASLAAMRSAKAVTVRPHILLCSVCQYGGGTRPPFKPDNLPELLQMILHERPDVSIQLVEGADWMICAPCPQRAPGQNACVNVMGSGGLSNQKRDLDMLQTLGLEYGSTMKARELFRLIFEKIPSTREICRRGGNCCPSVWWDGCGESNVKQGNAQYEKGRRELSKEFKFL